MRGAEPGQGEVLSRVRRGAPGGRDRGRGTQGRDRPVRGPGRFHEPQRSARRGGREVEALAEPDIGLTLHRLDVIAGREGVALRRFESLSPYIEDAIHQKQETRALKAYCLARCGRSAEAAAILHEALDPGQGWPGWSSSSAVEVALAALLPVGRPPPSSRSPTNARRRRGRPAPWIFCGRTGQVRSRMRAAWGASRTRPRSSSIWGSARTSQPAIGPHI